MKLVFKTAAAAVLLSLGVISSASAQDRAQPIQAEAGQSLNDAYVAKINREGRRDERQGVFTAATPVTIDAMRHEQLAVSAGLMPTEAAGWSLDEVAAAKASHNTRRDERQVYVSSRNMEAFDTVGNEQLIATAGLTPAEARGLSLNDLYVLKINREGDRDERQF